jgi:hypothetical protein
MINAFGHQLSISPEKTVRVGSRFLKELQKDEAFHPGSTQSLMEASLNPQRSLDDYSDFPRGLKVNFDIFCPYSLGSCSSAATNRQEARPKGPARHVLVLGSVTDASSVTDARQMESGNNRWYLSSKPSGKM